MAASYPADALLLFQFKIISGTKLYEMHKFKKKTP